MEEPPYMDPLTKTCKQEAILHGSLDMLERCFRINKKYRRNHTSFIIHIWMNGWACIHTNMCERKGKELLWNVMLITIMCYSLNVCICLTTV